MTNEKKKYNAILAIDDHKMITNGLTMLLGDYFKHFYVAHDGATGTSLALQHFPDIIIVDYALPDISGDLLVRELHYRIPAAKILAYSFTIDSDVIIKMLRAGVNGYLIKSEDDQELLKAVNNLINGQDYFCKEARNHIIRRFSNEEDERLKVMVGNTEFSSKEVEIIRLLCKQKNAKEISSAIFLSVRTVEQYRSNIMKRIGAKSIVGILKFAMKSGLIDLDDL